MIIQTKYGPLIILKKGNKENGYRATAECYCGNTFISALADMKRGQTKSCGCLTLKHGMCGERIYQTWSSMQARCYNDKNKAYKNYGGRGIKVLWKTFKEFYSDMKDTYENHLTIERIDNNGDYCKNNCIWITKGRQKSNTRASYIIEYKGEKKCLKDWCKELGIKYQRTLDRLRKLNWTVARALETPKINKQFN